MEFEITTSSNSFAQYLMIFIRDNAMLTQTWILCQILLGLRKGFLGYLSFFLFSAHALVGHNWKKSTGDKLSETLGGSVK